MEIARYSRPSSLEEAIRLIREEDGQPLGGGVWANLVHKRIGHAVDLSRAGLRYIRIMDGRAEIGAMTTLRDIEISPELHASYNGAFAEATGHVVGVQLRNVLTVGGSVSGRYGFSDILTLLLALNASLNVHRLSSGGSSAEELPLERFLEEGSGGKFLLESVSILRPAGAAFQSVRVSSNDFAILNAGAVRYPAGWRIAVGARPASARLSSEAAKALEGIERPSEADAGRAGEAAAAELAFGDDTRGTAGYRKSVCSALVRRAILEAAR